MMREIIGVSGIVVDKLERVVIVYNAVAAALHQLFVIDIDGG